MDKGAFLSISPKSSSLSKMSFPRVVGTDVAVVLVSNAGLAKVSGIVSFGIMLGVFNSWDTAIAKKIPYHWKALGEGLEVYQIFPNI